MSLLQFLEEIGVTPIINLGGTKSFYGGHPLSSAVRTSIQEMWDIAVDIEELNLAISSRIATDLCAQKALIVNGAAGGTLLGVNALLTCASKYKICLESPVFSDVTELIVLRTQMGQYSYLLEQAGAKIRDVGYVNRMERRHIIEAIGPETCGLLFLMGPGLSQIGPSLQDIVELAHDANIPVFVSGAALASPKTSLRKLLQQGVDLITISGGKYLGSTQTSGLLVGREDLISAAAAVLHPRHGPGRALKVSKEDMIATYIAFQESPESRDDLEREYHALQEFSLRLNSVIGSRARVEYDDKRYFYPAISVDFSSVPGTANKLHKQLLSGNPRIFVRYYADIDVLSLERSCVTEAQFEFAFEHFVQILKTL